MTDTTYKKYDTFATYIANVRLAQDPKVYKRDDETHDVVLTYCDSSRFDNLEDMWVDARVHRSQADRAKKLRKGDNVVIEGKIRFKRQTDGNIRAKIYDARISTFTMTQDRSDMEPVDKGESPKFE